MSERLHPSLCGWTNPEEPLLPCNRPAGHPDDDQGHTYTGSA